MIELIKQQGLKFSIGAMVGESPVLAVQGAQFGAAVKDQTLYTRFFPWPYCISIDLFKAGNP